MGRPREHDDATAQALLAAGERLVDEHGVAALSARRLASEVGTTTRAVYSLFGSMDALVAALGSHAFDLLGEAVASLPKTKNPRADLVAAGLAFRAFVCAHPSLFQIAIQRTAVAPELVARFRPAAQDAMVELERRVTRLEPRGDLGQRSVHGAAMQFHALCEGLAALELRGVIAADEAEEFWRSALSALVAGFATPPARRRPLGQGDSRH
jgi:AcrR family transcriptional regulator